MRNERELLLDCLRRLNQSGIPYMLTGSMASNQWGIPRSTHDIDIVIHPQSIIHSLIEMQDTSVLAQLGWADMRLPLLYAMSWPERIATDWPQLDLVKAGDLTFREPDRVKYPCINLAYAAGRAGGTMPAVLNGANEQAVALILDEKIPR